MAQLEDVIYLKQKAIRKLITDDSWDKALQRLDAVIERTWRTIRRIRFSSKNRCYDGNLCCDGKMG